jgi:hypothetical protein
MSRAFVKEDAGGWGDPGRRYTLPARDDPGYDEAAAEALLEEAPRALQVITGARTGFARSWSRYASERNAMATSDSRNWRSDSSGSRRGDNRVV